MAGASTRFTGSPPSALWTVTMPPCRLSTNRPSGEISFSSAKGKVEPSGSIFRRYEPVSAHWSSSWKGVGVGAGVDSPGASVTSSVGVAVTSGRGSRVGAGWHALTINIASVGAIRRRIRMGVLLMPYVSPLDRNLHSSQHRVGARHVSPKLDRSYGLSG